MAEGPPPARQSNGVSSREELAWKVAVILLLVLWLVLCTYLWAQSG